LGTPIIIGSDSKRMRKKLKKILDNYNRICYNINILVVKVQPKKNLKKIFDKLLKVCYNIKDITTTRRKYV